MKTSLKNNQRNRQKGFSLIELMIVVAIIGILSAIAVPNYQRFQRKSRQSEAKATLAAIWTAQKSYFAEFNGGTDSLQMSGYSPEGTIEYGCGWGAAAATLKATRDTRPAVTGHMNTNNAGLCTPANSCALGTGAQDPTGFTAPTTTAISAAVATCNGNIGGAAVDRWSMNATKVLTNTQDGT